MSFRAHIEPALETGQTQGKPADVWTGIAADQYLPSSRPKVVRVSGYDDDEDPRLPHGAQDLSPRALCQEMLEQICALDGLGKGLRGDELQAFIRKMMKAGS